MCFIYLPPNDLIDNTEIEKLINQLPRTFITDLRVIMLVGDAQTHKKIIIVENINNNLRLYNNKKQTFIHSATNSTIDLFISLL